MLKHCFCCLCSAILAARYVGLLIPWPRMEHIPTTFGRHSLNYWTARGALKLHISEIGITVCILKMRRPRSRFLHNFCKFLQRLSATTKFPHRFPDFMLRAFFFFFFHCTRISLFEFVTNYLLPGMGEPGGLLSMGLHRFRHDWSDLAAAAALHCKEYWLIILAMNLKPA